MRILAPVAPTSEQLTILADTRPGTVVIKGSAGSGKTTTALLRLKQLSGVFLSRRTRLGLDRPVRVLVLTYNRTLEGYITELARQQVVGNVGLQIQVATFGKWARDLVPGGDILDADQVRRWLTPLVTPLPGSNDFLIDEVEYLLGRFVPGSMQSYLTARRDGRGSSPRVEMPLRARLLADVVTPYAAQKSQKGKVDWNDIALAAKDVSGVPPWDIIIVDEAQDFSANQVRAILPHLADPHSLTFVIDAAQRIYPRFFHWREVGINVEKTHPLKKNYRNTRQIAAFARPLVEGLKLDGDGDIPDFSQCDNDGPFPIVVSGKYSAQVDFFIEHITNSVDLTSESVAFLQPKGGKFFNYLKMRLSESGINFCQLTRASVWPTGPENVAICTLHSAKGLEFDHVILPGLNGEVTPHGTADGDTQLDSVRRLVAMGLGRARRSVYLGFKPEDPSTVLTLLDKSTYKLVTR